MHSRDAEREAAAFLMIGFDGPALTSAALRLLERGAFGVILFARNFVHRSQLAELCAEIKAIGRARPGPTAGHHRVAIAVDQEGGRVQRLRGPGFTDLPSARDIGRFAGASLEDAEERAAALGRLCASELRPLGIDINFAPVLDVDSNPANPVIGDRSYSSDPQVVARLGVAFIRGLQAGDVAACGKHFPGHGDTDRDSHLELPRLDHDLDRLGRIELLPFQAAAKADVAAIMTSHILFPALDPTHPATMSAKVLGLLRSELRYEGLVVSDDLEMQAIADHHDLPEAAIAAVNAGCDLLLVCHDAARQEAIVAGLAKAIADGRCSAERVVEAATRRSRVLTRFVR
jgi:beta-N-acetylhexosaminidase